MDRKSKDDHEIMLNETLASNNESEVRKFYTLVDQNPLNDFFRSAKQDRKLERGDSEVNLMAQTSRVKEAGGLQSYNEKTKILSRA